VSDKAPDYAEYDQLMHTTWGEWRGIGLTITT
jgi:hypothetical protein